MADISIHKVTKVTMRDRNPHYCNANAITLLVHTTDFRNADRVEGITLFDLPTDMAQAISDAVNAMRKTEKMA